MTPNQDFSPQKLLPSLPFQGCSTSVHNCGCSCLPNKTPELGAPGAFSKVLLCPSWCFPNLPVRSGLCASSAYRNLLSGNSFPIILLLPSNTSRMSHANSTPKARRKLRPSPGGFWRPPNPELSPGPKGTSVPQGSTLGVEEFWGLTWGRACTTVSSRALMPVAIFSSFSTEMRSKSCSAGLGGIAEKIQEGNGGSGLAGRV